MLQTQQSGHWAEGFSCPQIEFSDGHAAHILNSRAKALIELYLNQAEPLLDAGSDGLKAFLANGAHTEGGMALWDWSLGKLYEAVVSDKSDGDLSVAASAALHLGKCGHQGQWQARFNQPVRLRFDRWMLPPAAMIRAESHGTHLDLELGQGKHRRTLSFLKGAYWTSVDLTALPTLWAHGTRFSFIDGPLFFDGTNGLRHPIDHEGLEAIMAWVEAALGLLKTHASIYFPWVQRFIHFILPVVSPIPGAISSGNILNQHGIVQLSNVSTVHQMAEMLVHEAAHQHFYLLEMAGAYDDGTDRNTYYSPVVQKNRHIRKILLAYHAFANVVLLGRVLAAAGLEDGYWRDNEERVLGDLVQLEAPLKHNQALTEYGNCLFKPLANQLAEVGVTP